MFTSQRLALGLLIAASLVSAHGKIASAIGDLGGKGAGLGILAGAANLNSQGDVTIFQGGAFGKTTNGGAIVAATDLAAQEKNLGATIPQISSAAGVLTMVYHQVNGDGAGPITCQISADATGKTFVAMKVTTNVAGTNGNSGAANQDFPLVAEVPAGTACTGTVGALKNVCSVKCANPAAAGPFGGTVLVQQVAGKKRDVVGGSLAARAKAALVMLA